MGLIFKEGFSFSGYERNGLFLNREGTGFKNISGVSGVDSILDGRSGVMADFDNDGDLDLFLTTIQKEGHLLYRNNVGQDTASIRLTLQGTKSGRDAFGAVIRARTPSGIQTRIKSGGNGFMAFHDSRIIIGMGTAKSAEWIEIQWPSGLTERYNQVQAGSSLKIVEGEKKDLENINQPYTNFSLPEPLSEEESNWSLLTLEKGSSLPVLKVRRLNTAGTATPVELKLDGSTYINFWATFCGPCRREMPELEKLYPDFQKKGIKLIGLSLDSRPEGVLAFAKRLGISYPVYLVDKETLESIFGSSSFPIPLSLLTDESGKLKQVFKGWNSETKMDLARILESN
jgi:thiol-disulfide isomerase/thioredoxin